jgi:hypothetical protein
MLPQSALNLRTVIMSEQPLCQQLNLKQHQKNEIIRSRDGLIHPLPLL